MAEDTPEPAEINRQNAEFWAKQQARTEELMANPELADAAYKEIQDEQLRKVPVYWQRPLERVLEKLVALGAKLQSAQARKSRRLRGPDPLTEHIEAIVRRRPNITEEGLFDALEAEAGISELIVEIDGKSIIYENRHGHLKKASISGLKDRLSRAKQKNKKLHSR